MKRYELEVPDSGESYSHPYLDDKECHVSEDKAPCTEEHEEDSDGKP